MYPFKFNPILKSTIWGGEKIIPFKHLNIEQPQVGESWEISNVPGDESVVANGTEAGKNLSQLVKEYKGSLVGESNYQRFGDNFPLLIKFIDACDDLSIQVHQEEGTLTKTGYQLTGIHPRNFIISRNGRYLLVACRDSNSIQVFERDSQTGLLKDTGKTIKTNKPVCLKFTF